MHIQELNTVACVPAVHVRCRELPEQDEAPSVGTGTSHHPVVLMPFRRMSYALNAVHPAKRQGVCCAGKK